MAEDALKTARALQRRLERAQGTVFELRAERDRAVKDAYEAGASVREIARELGISHQRVAQITGQS